MSLFVSNLLSRSPALSNLRRRNHHRTVAYLANIDRVRDLALDHVVQREKNLKPAHNLINLLSSNPSNSLPLSEIAETTPSLQIPIRPIEFIRTYPSLFEELLPEATTAVVPHVRLTPEAIDLNSEEQLIYQSEEFKQQAADRLMKLLMLRRMHKIPLSLIDVMKWDFGLPDNYLETIVPEFPDYFRVDGSSSQDPDLELVCWCDSLAVSAAEKNLTKTEKTVEFPERYSKGFVMDRDYKKWLKEWKELPYISPYENASHLTSASDQSDKWAVAVLHELLHITVPKKCERDTLLRLAECMGLRPRIKRAIIHHPGIFYMSSKLGTHTVVLREAFDRNVLLEKHGLMKLRTQYIHLMHTAKPGAVKQKCEKQKDQPAPNIKGKGDRLEKVERSDLFRKSSSVVEDDDADSDDFEDEEEEEEDYNVGSQNKLKGRRAADFVTPNYEHKNTLKKHKQEKSFQSSSNWKKRLDCHFEYSSRRERNRGDRTRGRFSEVSNSFSPGRRLLEGTDSHTDFQLRSSRQTNYSRGSDISYQDGAKGMGSSQKRSSRITEFERGKSLRMGMERWTDGHMRSTKKNREMPYQVGAGKISNSHVR